MKLMVNGEERSVPGPASIADFLAAHGLERRMVVVEHNGEIVARDRYGEIELCDNDTLEIVQMVTGG